MRHRADLKEPEESLAPIVLRLFLFFNACALVLIALRSDVPDPDGEILVPVEGVSHGDLSDTFHERRDLFRRHGALDIPAPWGTPVVAAGDGIIHRLIESDRGGLGIYQIDPRSRRCYYYAHLERYASGLEEGAYVSRGDPLGFVGTTGNASEDAPHLHFAAYELDGSGSCFAGTPVNPYTLLSVD